MPTSNPKHFLWNLSACVLGQLQEGPGFSGAGQGVITLLACSAHCVPAEGPEAHGGLTPMLRQDTDSEAPLSPYIFLPSLTRHALSLVSITLRPSLPSKLNLNLCCSWSNLPPDGRLTPTPLPYKIGCTFFRLVF